MKITNKHLAVAAGLAALYLLWRKKRGMDLMEADGFETGGIVGPQPTIVPIAIPIPVRRISYPTIAQATPVYSTPTPTTSLATAVQQTANEVLAPSTSRSVSIPSPEPVVLAKAISPTVSSPTLATSSGSRLATSSPTLATSGGSRSLSPSSPTLARATTSTLSTNSPAPRLERAIAQGNYFSLGTDVSKQRTHRRLGLTFPTGRIGRK